MARACMLVLVWAAMIACTPTSNPAAAPDVAVTSSPDAGGDCAAAAAINQGRMIRVESDAALAPALVVPCP
jgi:hypothetical protein